MKNRFLDILQGKGKKTKINSLDKSDRDSRYIDLSLSINIGLVVFSLEVIVIITYANSYESLKNKNVIFRKIVLFSSLAIYIDNSRRLKQCCIQIILGDSGGDIVEFGGGGNCTF